MASEHSDGAKRARPPRWSVVYGLLALCVVVVVADLANLQRQAFADQPDAVRSLQRIEYLIAVFFLAMIGGAIYYGGRLRKEFGRQADAREAHVAQLESTEGELR